MSDLYFECNAGISGDMAVAAMLDAGASTDVLMSVLDTVPVSGFSVEIGRVKKAGIDCCDFNVILDKEHENHDHDMEYLFGHEYQHEHEHQHEHQYHHEHTRLADIYSIIERTQMSERARKLAKKIFDIIALAESKAHGISVDQVHFHEVGALDSIVDVISLAVCYDDLNPSRVYVPYLCEGTGTIRCQHGILSVPVPAVADIAEAYSIPFKIMDARGEFVTPTGAAFIAAVATDFCKPPLFIIKNTGFGAGKRVYERPNILRVFKLQSLDCPHGNAHADAHGNGDMYKLETNIDDCTGEALGFVMEQLFIEGAHDVHYVPCFMKKNRPAYLLSVLCKKEDISRMEDIIFKHTTTIGIRRYKVDRTVLERRIITVKTSDGDALVKTVSVKDNLRYYPEYESVAEISRKTGKAFSEVYKEIQEAALKMDL